MALRTRFVGSGLGIRPIALGDEPYRADSAFDSTLRIPIRPRAIAAPAETALSVPTRPLLGEPPPVNPPVQPPGPFQPQPPAQPPVQPPGGPGPSLPTSYDPSRLNFEGLTGQELLGGVSPTTTGYAPREADIDALLGQLEGFSGLRIFGNWRQQLAEDPQYFLERVRSVVLNPGAARSIIENRGGHYDTSMRQRLQDWYTKLEGAVTRTATTENPEYKKLFLGQEAYNRGLERLKQAGAVGTRQEEEAALQALASRGLLDSGIAARELTNLRESRLQNYYDAAANMNQMLLSNELGRLSEADLARLRSDLDFRNQQNLLRLRASLEKQAQPPFWQQLLGLGGGIGLSLLARQSPISTGALYGEEDPGFRNA